MKINKTFYTAIIYCEIILIILTFISGIILAFNKTIGIIHLSFSLLICLIFFHKITKSSITYTLPHDIQSIKIYSTPIQCLMKVSTIVLKSPNKNKYIFFIDKHQIKKIIEEYQNNK